MFDKFRQINQLRELQKQMAQKTAAAEVDGVEVTVNGNLEIVDVQVSSEANAETLGESFQDATNKAIKKIQAEIAGVMRGGGLGF